MIIAKQKGYKTRNEIMYGNMHIYPADSTAFEEIKCILPGTYVNVTKYEIVPVPLNIQNISFDRMCDLTIEIVSRIIKEYWEKEKFYVALTGGNDSRVNLAFAINNLPINDIHTYTMKTPSAVRFKEDINIAKKITQSENIKHDLLDMIPASQETKKAILAYFPDIPKGSKDYDYICNIIDMVNTQKQNGIFSFTHGHVIDQIGKSGTYKQQLSQLITGKYLSAEINAWSRDAAKAFGWWLSQ